MAKIRLDNNLYEGEDGRAVRWPLAKQFTAEHALKLSAEYRSRGIKAEAIQNGGGESIEPRVETASPTQYVPVTWRGITPTRAGADHVITFRDHDSDTLQVVKAPGDPWNVIHKLQDLAGYNRETKTLDKFSGHPMYSKFIGSLPPEEGSLPAPAFNQPAPRPATPGSVLRPGSNAHSIEDLPQRSAQPQRIVREDFAAWERTATAKAYQERCKTDPAFLAWADSQAATR